MRTYFGYRVVSAIRFLWLISTPLAAMNLHAAPVVKLEEIASGFQSPVEMVHSGDGSGRLFVVEQAGKIKVLRGNAALPTPFLDISALIASGGERGLLGLAFHPQYAINRAFYVYYTRAGDGALTIVRYLRSAADAAVADPASAAVILTIPHPGFQNHNGGHLAFGHDGYLYIGTGDGGGGGDPDQNGQRLTTRLGKLLRVAVDGGTGYAIPPTNPFANRTDCSVQCPEIWAYGLRNPWKFTFDRVNGDLFIGDVGQGLWEEINHVPAGAAGPKNFGWNTFEGNSCYSPATNCSLPNHTPPIIAYGHNNSNFGGFSVTGGYRYRGARYAAMRGFYFYGDFASQRVWVASPDSGGVWRSEFLFVAPSSISSFAEDEAGELYVVGYGTGKIYALTGDTDTTPRQISLSVDIDNPRAGSPITITALVRGANPTGTVTFLADASGSVSGPIGLCNSVGVRALPGDTNTAVATCTTTANPAVKAYTAGYANDAANTIPSASVDVKATAGGPANYTDLWWAGQSEDGWGMTIIQKGATQFNAFYVYDAAGKPVWYTMSGGTWNVDFTRYSGPLYQPRGAPFNAYDVSRFVVGAPVGNASLTFTSANTATLEYSIGSQSGTKSISRLNYGAPDAQAKFNVRDIWWVGPAENGWGINLSQQERTLFAAWYTYDATGNTTWFVMSGGTWFGSVYSGLLYTATSSPWVGVQYSAQQFKSRWVAQISFNFQDASNATMTYTVDGITQSKAISRFRF
jgi:glucose/arabinose dehydrogenase